MEAPSYNITDNHDVKGASQSMEKYTRGGHIHERNRRQLKFRLDIRDDDDGTHWMLLPPNTQRPLSIDSSHPEEEGTNSIDIIDENDSIFKDKTCHKNQEDFHSIPIIDLSLPLHGRNGYAEQIRRASQSSGFFYVINHGVDEILMQAVMQKSRDFFDLGLEEKRACMNEMGRVGSGYRGYFGIGMEDLENKDGTRDLVEEEADASEFKMDCQKRTGAKMGNKPGDQKEGFDCGLESIPGFHENSPSHQAYIDFFGVNHWPDELNHDSIVGFRETLTEYGKAMLKLSDVLMVAFAVSLSSVYKSTGVTVPSDYFMARSRNPMCTLRLLHYPPTNTAPVDDAIKSPTGCGAHTDYGLFTILQQDNIGGLQVRNRGNLWVDAHPLSGSFVINVGDMLSWWTEGEYASTVHRVISPSKHIKPTASHRYSIPFFFNPDFDAEVRPMREICRGNDGGLERKTAIELLKDRYLGTFQAV